MNTRKNVLLLTMVALVAICAFSAFASTANAQSALNYETHVDSTNPSVNEKATYTFTLTNKGSANITSANITVPTGYIVLSHPSVSQQPSSGNWNVSLEDSTIALTSTTGSGLTNAQSVTVSFEAQNSQVAGEYSWSTKAVSSEAKTSTVTTNFTLVISTIVPVLEIMAIGAGIAFLNSGVNRVLINYFIGWEQYRVMQKEMAEFRQESMAAARSNDKKRMEKVKKKQSQINNMQAKMFKPQMLQIGISFVYLIVWFLVLIPTFQNISMAYLPGFGPIAVVWLYPIFSIFLGTLASRIIGIMPIDNTQ